MEIHLASMENISSWAFRKMFGQASDSYTGMLSLNNLVKRGNTWDEIDTFPIEGQRQWVQVATSKETECALFITKLEEEIKKHPEKDNIYGIQLNCSCPSPNLIRIGQGPALIKRATKVGNLIKELLKQNKYKVGIKVRLGLNEFEVRQRKIFNLFSELSKIVKENPNFTNVTVHFKHAQESSSSEYDYSLINELASYDLPIVINGGIKSKEDIDKIMGMVAPENKKNIKGIMMGREALKSPNCFLKISQTPGKSLSFEDAKKKFNDFCNEHMPKEIYLKTMKERCKWIN